MNCSSCGTVNEAGRKFCHECGTRLVPGCPLCGAQNPATARFCGDCGAKLAAFDASIVSPTPAGTAGGSVTAGAGDAPIAERRHVSILFADLVGFTTISEGRDSEAVRELLSRYFDLASEVIGHYGGVVEKFIGDAVMAVWGAPTAHEDDAERAVRAGLDLVEAVRALGPEISARAGVLTGEAAVTLGAINQGMVAGDLVNTASRLQSVAPPGTVLVGEATQRAASSSIAFERAGDQILKGKVAPVAAWRAIRVVAQRRGRGRADRLEAPFVGRDTELQLLRELFHATARERRTRLVSIIGQAGIGKSRLSWEFLKYVDGVVEGVFWHEGRSPAYGEGVTFWALGEMVRYRAGLVEGDDPAVTREKVGESVARFVPDETERRWVESALLALLGVGEASGASREELFSAWRTYFERIAAQQTVALVFEDLHWADTGLIDFIDHLLEWSRGVPILIVTLARPELLERRPDWGTGRRNFIGLGLEPLTEAAMRALLGGLVHGLPEAAIRSIVARADGIPLYAVETVRMLVADGRLRESEDGYVPTGELGELAVPETLQALIAARLDGLEPADRILVQDAAVLGQSFTLAGLAAVSGLEPDVIEARLRGLGRLELITQDIDPRSPERGQYAFVQALIREVAYSTLAKRDRRSRHLAAARYFESLGEDELAGALAAHYLAAYHAAPEGPEGEAMAAQARVSLKGAAERARALGSHQQCATFLAQAMTITTDPAEVADLLERAGEATSLSGRHDEAIALLGQAVAAQRERGDRVATARALGSLGRALLTPYRTNDAISLLTPAAAEFADLGDRAEYLGILAQLARAHFLDESDQDALEWSDRTLAVAERLDLVEIVADTLVTKGSTLMTVGRTYEGVGVLETGQRLAERVGLNTAVLRAMINMSNVSSLDDIRASIEQARLGLEVGRRVGLRSYSLTLMGNAIGSAIRTGEWAWALAESTETLSYDLDETDRILIAAISLSLRAHLGDDIGAGIEEVEELVGRHDEPLLRISLTEVNAHLAFVEGRFADSHGLWRAITDTSSMNAPIMLPEAARAALWAGEPDLAREALGRVAASGARGRALRADTMAIEAGLLAADGRPDEAEAAYAEARKRLRDLQIDYQLMLADVDAVRFLGADNPIAVDAAAEAREIGERIGARPLLARLDALTSGSGHGNADGRASGRDPAADSSTTDPSRSEEISRSG